MEDISSPILRVGDLVSFMVDSAGYLGVPSIREPVPERADIVTHLRAIPVKLGSKELPGDYSTRCFFRILGDQGQLKPENITYGSIIRLMHEPSSLFAVATDNEDLYDGGTSGSFSVQLKKTLSSEEALAAQWMISSRYRLRAEGDFVRVNDFVVLRSARFKQKTLNTIRVSSQPSIFDSLVGLKADSLNKKGWQIFRVAENSAADSSNRREIENPVLGGDFVKLLHQELRGYLICRGDNEKELSSLVNPLGRYTLGELTDPEHHCAAFIRSHRGQHEHASCLNIWQILPQNVMSLGRFKSGSAVRLRHLLTGVYLCMRDTTDLDCETVLWDSQCLDEGISSVSLDGAPRNHRRYSVATCVNQEPSTLFHMHTPGDISMNGLTTEINPGTNMIGYGQSVFFVHHLTQLMLTSSTSGRHSSQPRWNDYSGDLPLRPKGFVGDFAILSETFRIDRVDNRLVEDTLYIAKFRPLVKAASTCLQLTPRMDRLYLPLYRHLNVAIHTLVRWVLGRCESEGHLISHPRGSAAMKKRRATDAPATVNEGSDSSGSEANEDEDEDGLNVVEEPLMLRSNSINMTPLLSPLSREGSYRRIGAAVDKLGGISGISSEPISSDERVPLNISSISPWVGRGMCTFLKAAIPAPILSERVDDVLAQVSVNASRQDTVRDSGVLEMLQYYINIVFCMLKVQTKQINQKKDTSRRKGSSMSQQEREAIYIVPQIVTGCCVLCYDLINVCLIENPRTAVRLLGTQGQLLSMMSHEFLGWKPPIEQLLLSEQLSRKSAIFESSGLPKINLEKILSSEDVQEIIHQMYTFHASRNNADLNLLRLLKTIACPGKKPNKYIQDQIVEDLFLKCKVVMRPRAADEEKIMTENGCEIHHCLLFSTRRLKDSNTWEILFNADFRFEREKIDRSNLKDKIEVEYNALRDLFNSCCTAETGVLGVRDGEKLAELLGFAGAELVAHGRTLNKCTFEKFTEFWWSNRSFYFPSLTSALNYLTASDARSILSGERTVFESPQITEPEYPVDDFVEAADDNEAFYSDNPMKEKGITDTAVTTKFRFSLPNVKSKALDDFQKNVSGRRKSVGEFISKSLDWRPKAPEFISKLPDVKLPAVPNLSLPTAPSINLVSSKVSPAETVEEFESADRIRRRVTARIPAFDFSPDYMKLGEHHRSPDGPNSAMSSFFAPISELSARKTDVDFDPVIVGLEDTSPESIQARKEELERYSGLFITLSKSFARANEQLKTKKITNSQNWQILSDVLKEEGDNRTWFREACILLSELCRGKNGFSQDYISELIPADLILSVLLRSGLMSAMMDKIIGATLLTSVYIRHDFVFAATAIAAAKDTPVAVREVDWRVETSAGKLFSAMNRRTFTCIGEEEGAIMRRMLWTFLRSEIKSMDFSFTSREVSEFNVAVLRLANELLQLGFFDEADSFLISKQRAQELLVENRLSTNKKSFFRSGNDANAENEQSFDTIALENLLIEKVLTTLQELRTNFKAMQIHVINEVQFSGSRGILSEEEAEKAARKISMKRGPSLGIHAAKYVGLFLDRQYSESFRIQAIEEVISILWAVLESRQLRRIRNIVGLLKDPSSVFDDSILYDKDNPTQDIQNLKFSTKIKDFIKQQFYEPRDLSLSYFRALLAATLFYDNKLRGNTYTLIHRSISREIDMVNIIKNLKIVPTVEEAAAARFLSVFYDTVEKFWRQLLRDPNNPSKYIVGTIKFCFEAMTSVCFRKFKEVSKSFKPARDRRKMKFSFPDIGRSQKGLYEGRVPTPSGKYSRLSVGRGSIELTNASFKTVNLEDVLSHTSRAQYSLPHPALPWIHHVVKPTVVKLLTIIKSILRVEVTHETESYDTVLTWDALTLAEKFIINRSFCFIAAVSTDSDVMAFEFFVHLAPILKKFWWVPECIGAAELMAILCKVMDLDQLLEKKDIKMLFEFIADLEEYESPQKMCACRSVYNILANPQAGSAASAVVKKVRTDIVENGSIRSYIYFDDKRASDFELDLHLMIMRIIASTARVRTDHLFVDSLKSLITGDFCIRMLTSSTPLQVRTCFFELAARIYEHEEVPCDEYILADMKMFSDLEQCLADTTDLEKLEYPIIEYFYEGIIRQLLRRIMSVNGIKISELREVINRTGLYVSEALEKPTKKKMIEIAQEQNFGMRSESDLGEPLNPESFTIGSVNQRVFFESVSLLYKYLTAFDNKFLGLLVLDKARSDLLFNLLAATQMVYKRMYPSQTAMVPEAQDEFIVIFEMLPRSIDLKKRLEQKKHIDTFIRSDGSDSFLSGVVSFLLPPPVDENLYLSNLDAFKSHIDFAPVLPIEALKQTPFFEVLENILSSTIRFISIGGLDLSSGTHDKKLKNLNDFDLWIQGGGRYFQALGSYLGKDAHPSIVSYTLLHILCVMLSNDIDKLRDSKMAVKKMMQLVEEETNRLRDVQNALSHFGISDMIVRTIARCEDTKVQDPLISDLGPLTMKLGSCLLASGNPKVQEDIMNLEMSVHFAPALRYILRKCSQKITKFLKKKLDGPYPVYIFRVISEIFRFCGMICSGHNARGRDFLRAQGAHNVMNVNLVGDITYAQNVLLQVIIDQLKYITNESFYDQLGAFVWRSMSDVKRRFFAWHLAHEMDFVLMSQVSLAVVEGFDALVSICQDQCLDNQLAATPVLSLCPALLEFTGAIQLRVTAQIGGKGPSVFYNCGDPLQFYSTYKTESKKLGIFSDDKHANHIRRCKQQWKELKSLRNRFTKAKSSKDLIGIDLNLFLDLFCNAEQACLQMINALLDGDSEEVVDTLSENLDEGILMQNMDNLFKLSLSASGTTRKKLKNNTVYYLSLLSCLSSFVDKPSGILDKYIDAWKSDCLKAGNGINSHFAAVEITSPNGMLQKVFFPIPDFVLEYWSYPRVQQAKDRALWSVSRESPEDKLADFFLKMQGIVTVMRRQEFLTSLFPPFKWMRYLMRSDGFFSYLPLIGMRQFILWLTLLLNIYHAYLNFRHVYPWYIANEADWCRDFFDWEDRRFMFFIIGCLHSGFCGLLAFNDFINSPEADELGPIELPLRDKLKPIGYLCAGLEIVRNVSVMLLSAWWPICITGFSVLALVRNGFWYALILLDVVPQIQLMSFLVEAITRNAKKIWFTLVLAAVFLYLFAIGNSLFIPNQYGFDGRHTCADVISCFKLHLDFGLTNPPEWLGSEGISPFTGKDAMETTYGYIISLIFGSVYNWVFVIIINLVLQAIISGLIIDTFGEMRAENEEIENDIRSGCFICSIDKDEFEQAGVSYEEHISDEHNMWKYIWFLIYLELKDPLSFSAPEYSAFKLLGNKQDFVRLGPVKKSLSIERRSGQVKEQFTPKIIFHGVKKTQEQQMAIFEELQQLRVRGADHTTALKQHDKALEMIQRSLLNSSQAAGHTDIFVRDLQEQFSSVSSELRESVDQFTKLQATLSALSSQLRNSSQQQSHPGDTK